ncbi:hypothetical protein [Variovorax defluvii]|uniref:hypothetical protein n=1 Tax=Variovorax defluvii TaxID=913761 RepID=UPI0031E4EDED
MSFEFWILALPTLKIIRLPPGLAAGFQQRQSHMLNFTSSAVVAAAVVSSVTFVNCLPCMELSPRHRGSSPYAGQRRPGVVFHEHALCLRQRLPRSRREQGGLTPSSCYA